MSILKNHITKYLYGLYSSSVYIVINCVYLYIYATVYHLIILNNYKFIKEAKSLILMHCSQQLDPNYSKQCMNHIN